MTTLPRTPSFKLSGRRALVTGASRGIGLGAAVALAEADAHVVLAARSEPDLVNAVDAITAIGGSCEACVMDINETELVNQRICDMPAIDILVNNAGINRPGPFADMSTEDFDAVLQTNVRSTFFLTQAVAKAMQEKAQGGSIISISSQMGKVGGIDRSVYCTSKHAIEGFSKALAIELGEANVRVNTICPTFIRTPLTESTFANKERLAWIESKIKLGRVGNIEDIMGAIVFLASDAAAMITGSALMIDGGWTTG